MNNATDTLRKDHQLLQSEAWGQRCEHFVRTWAPNEPYDRSRFEAQFHALIRQTWIEAQEPVLKRLTDLAMCVPLSMVIPK